MNVNVEISIGEFFDKITILEIKQERIQSHSDENEKETDTGKEKKTTEQLKEEADIEAMNKEFEKKYPSK